jgi:hypothetical protein
MSKETPLPVLIAGLLIIVILFFLLANTNTAEKERERVKNLLGEIKQTSQLKIYMNNNRNLISNCCNLKANKKESKECGGIMLSLYNKFNTSICDKL